MLTKPGVGITWGVGGGVGGGGFPSLGHNFLDKEKIFSIKNVAFTKNNLFSNSLPGFTHH